RAATGRAPLPAPCLRCGAAASIMPQGPTPRPRTAQVKLDTELHPSLVPPFPAGAPAPGVVVVASTPQRPAPARHVTPGAHTPRPRPARALGRPDPAPGRPGASDPCPFRATLARSAHALADRGDCPPHGRRCQRQHGRTGLRLGGRDG